jgi:hypothetical protein
VIGTEAKTLGTVLTMTTTMITHGTMVVAGKMLAPETRTIIVKESVESIMMGFVTFTLVYI